MPCPRMNDSTSAGPASAYRYMLSGPYIGPSSQRTLRLNSAGGGSVNRTIFFLGLGAPKKPPNPELSVSWQVGDPNGI